MKTSKQIILSHQTNVFNKNSHSRQDCVAVAALATPGVPTGKLLYTFSHTPMSCWYDMSEGQVFLNKAQNI